jgi:hypothetical protein
MAIFALAIYVPVHLEGRYLAGFLAVLALCGLAGSTANTNELPPTRMRFALTVLMLGVAADLALYQVPVWRNMLQHKSPTINEEWQIGDAVLAQHMAPMSQVGVIAWTPNLHCDWAYIANLQITSEIASPEGVDLFWQSTPERQMNTLNTFQKAGAVAVFSHGKPKDKGSDRWQQLGQTGMWMYRF